MCVCRERAELAVAGLCMLLYGQGNMNTLGALNDSNSCGLSHLSMAVVALSCGVRDYTSLSSSPAAGNFYGT